MVFPLCMWNFSLEDVTLFNQTKNKHNTTWVKLFFCYFLIVKLTAVFVIFGGILIGAPTFHHCCAIYDVSFKNEYHSQSMMFLLRMNNIHNL